MDKKTINLAELYSEYIKQFGIEAGAEMTIKFQPFQRLNSKTLKRSRTHQLFILDEFGMFCLIEIEEKKEKKPQIEEINDDEIRFAQKLLEIKQSRQKTIRGANLKIWAQDIRCLKEIDLEGHKMTDFEIESAFIYAFQINRFWSEQGLIISPKTLLEHMRRTRKPTFREAFLNWLNTGGKLNAAHSRNRQYPQTTDVVKEGFEQLGIHINAG
jgi:hypothetical protein